MKSLLSMCVLLFTSFGISQTIALQSFGTGFTSPLEITNAGDSRLFVVEQGGNIKILNSSGTTNATPFLNVSSLISTGGERGLLGLAFHPNYANNGFFFINYTNTAGNTVIAKYTVTLTGPNPTPNVANTTGTILLTINQPYSNHNGGTLKFGPDGYLYIGMGDGGSGGDPQNYAQNINSNLGKMLRIDVNSTVAPFYTNPSTNPYVGVAGNDEIWAIGLRNPWKFSFNRLNGDLWIADVGQNAFEEVNKVPSPLPNTVNFGWRCYEGNTAFNTSGCVAQSATYTAIVAPSHTDGNCSVTGGYVYTGATYPNLQGKYLFTDYCNARIGIINSAGSLSYSQEFPNNNFATFGESNTGELFIASLGSGIIYRITDSSLGITNFEKNKYQIYPNPSKSEVYIEKSTGSYPIEVSIFDMKGKLLLTQKTQNIQKNTINTGVLSSGLYIMNIKDDREVSTTHKLLIE